jgi:preprotein translocase subunit Sec61beta
LIVRISPSRVIALAALVIVVLLTVAEFCPAVFSRIAKP